jgi:predicted nucleic acid-binding protein
MTATPPSSPAGAAVIDSSVVVAICAKETGTEPKALAELGHYSSLGYKFYAPGVLVSESLYVLCKKQESGALDAASHAQAITDLENLISGIQPPPDGDATLIRRAEEIRGNYTCRRSADGLYIALAEQLTATRPTVLLTFDQDLPKQAAKNAPTVNVVLLGGTSCLMAEKQRSLT